MNEPSKLSRRDWFRLRAPKVNQFLGSESPTAKNDVLKPIEHPPNHDGLDLAQLPPMREAVLSVAQINTLFSDIGGLATDVQLMQRTRSSARATAQQATNPEQLEFAKTSLLNGAIPRVQIRYRWKGSLWIDTLATQGTGLFKLVRIAHQNG